MLFLLLLSFALLAFFIGPWWSIALIAFAAALLWGRSGKQAFLSGFCAVLLAWICLSLFQSLPNGNMLAGRVSSMMQLPHWSLLLLVTALIGGIVGGLSALTGHLARKAFSKNIA